MCDKVIMNSNDEKSSEVEISEGLKDMLICDETLSDISDLSIDDSWIDALREDKRPRYLSHKMTGDDFLYLSKTVPARELVYYETDIHITAYYFEFTAFYNGETHIDKCCMSYSCKETSKFFHELTDEDFRAKSHCEYFTDSTDVIYFVDNNKPYAFCSMCRHFLYRVEQHSDYPCTTCIDKYNWIN